MCRCPMAGCCPDVRLEVGVEEVEETQAPRPEAWLFWPPTVEVLVEDTTTWTPWSPNLRCQLPLGKQSNP